MNRPKPTGKEVTFEFAELFFSRTDKRGIIEYGNDVFLRISDYPKDVMIGAPHNIVRHPQMPRSVFALFWQTLKNGHPIAAYVNNLSAKGDNYWVLAIAFPIRGGYLSIRLRPSSPLFEKIKGLYDQMISLESQDSDRDKGMEKAKEYLGSWLKDQNYFGYEAFMAEALVSELRLRDAQLHFQEAKAHKSGGHNFILQQIEFVAGRGAQTFRELFSQVDEFSKARELFLARTSDLQDRFINLRLLSLNMSISALRLGQGAATLNIVAKHFQSMASQIDEHLLVLTGAVERLGCNMHQTNLNLSFLKIQMDMVEFFVRESLSKLTGQESQGSGAFEVMESNKDAFIELAATSLESAQSALGQLSETLAHFTSSINQVATFVNGLELIRCLGAIEASRREELRQSFQHHVKQMAEFTDVLRKSTEELGQSTAILKRVVNNIGAEASVGSEALGDIFRLALTLKSQVA